MKKNDDLTSPGFNEVFPMIFKLFILACIAAVLILYIH